MIYTTKELLLPLLPSIPFPLFLFLLLLGSTSPTGKKQPPFPCAQYNFYYNRSFYLCLSCLGQALYVVLLNPISIHNIETADPNDSTSGYCIFEGILKATFDLSSIIWTTLILYAIFTSVIKNRSLESYEIIYLLIGFLFPLIAAIMYEIPLSLVLLSFSCTDTIYTSVGLIRSKNIYNFG